MFVQKAPAVNRCVRLEDAEKPRGEWNTLELVCVNGQSIHIVNGKVVMRLHDPRQPDGSELLPHAFGAISLQTEGAEVYYRNVEIRAITDVPSAFAGL